MRARFLVVASALLGCQGETVVPATTDSGTATDAGGCLLPGNVLRNGDFASGSSGWAPYSAKTESIDGPCGGRGLRVYDTKDYGSIGQEIARKVPKGSTVRARAYFRGLPGSQTPPSLTLIFEHIEDGGAARTQQAGSVATSGAQWEPTDVTAVLERDEDSIGVLIDSRTAAVDEFGVAAVSVVVEPPN